jgi:hypothetical protein
MNESMLSCYLEYDAEDNAEDNALSTVDGSCGALRCESHEQISPQRIPGENNDEEERERRMHWII